MSSKGVDRKHSQTALYAALLRTIGNLEFKEMGLGPDDLARHFLPPLIRLLMRFRSLRKKVIQKNARMVPGLFEYVMARTSYFDMHFDTNLQNRVPQIVILGAGYDTRAYRFATYDMSTRVFEVDIHTTQERKRTFLKKAHIETPENLVMAPIDFNFGSLSSVLEAVGFDSQQQTVFLWEGVSYYLEPESVNATLEFVASGGHPDTIIAFDYCHTLTEHNLKDYYGAAEFVQTWERHRSNEAFKFTVDQGRIDNFLRQRGLKALGLLDPDKIERAYLTLEDGTLLGHITGIFGFVVASPHVVA
jgi:methyltransferase (TIGR00027 family)